MIQLLGGGHSQFSIKLRLKDEPRLRHCAGAVARQVDDEEIVWPGVRDLREGLGQPSGIGTSLLDQLDPSVAFSQQVLRYVRIASASARGYLSVGAASTSGP